MYYIIQGNFKNVTELAQWLTEREKIFIRQVFIILCRKGK